MDQTLKWHMNRMTLTRRVVVALITFSGHCMKAGRWAWMRRVEHCPMNETWSKTFLRTFILNLQDVTPPCVFLHSATTTEASWTKHENWSQIGFTLKRRQHHTCLYSHLGVGENVNDSVLIGPSFVSTYRNLSKHCLSTWHTRSNLPREALAYGIVLLFQAV